jgi:hypothetical protein
MSSQRLSSASSSGCTGSSAGPSATGGSTGGGGSVPKWADSYQTKRGPANMLGKAGETWESGLTRGPANQIW